MIDDLQLKSVYSTDVDDVANDFYIPVLSEAISYKRVSGYFSSAALALFSSGIEALAYNGGKYQLLISNQISNQDYELIREGYRNREKFKTNITQNLSDYELLSAGSKKDFANLAFLIEVGVVDLKVGFTHKGLFHSKYGIISDKNNNKIFFSGSLNETEAAFINNYESITLVKSWNDNTTVINQEKHFDELWNNDKSNFIFVKEFNEIVNSTLMSYSKGKIVMDDALMSEDSIIVYYENNKLKIENTLESKSIIETERRIKKLKNKYLINGELWNFKDNLSINELEQIVEYLKEYGRRTGTNIVISESVKNYIDSNRFNIKEISKRGLLIKGQDDSLYDQIRKFNQIVSKEISRPLRSIQLWVSFYMAQMKRVGNFSVPGSGKTAMMYGTFAYLSEESVDEVNQIVMIGPKSSFKSWKDEFINVFGNKRKLRVLDVHAENFNPRMLAQNIDNYNLILINYESLQKYEDELTRILNPKTMLIFDEVHKIKKVDGARSDVALSLSRLVRYKYVLTGTPLPNGYIDAWNFMHILYENDYMNFFGYSQFQLKNMDTIQMEDFNERLFPFFWRVTKKDLEVPEVNPDYAYSVTTTSQEQQVLDLLWRKYSNQPFVLYTRLIQFSSNPSLLKQDISKQSFIDIDNDESEDIGYDGNLTFEYNFEMNDVPRYTSEELALIDSLSVSSKFNMAISKADSLVQEKKVVLIWCIFVDTMFKVVENLENLGHKVAMIYGEIKATEREKIITEFQNGAYDVLVANPHTLAESVSLHMVCHDAIYLEYSFNLTHMLQSRDRIHRLGLKESDETNYYYYYLRGQNGKRDTIDIKIYNRLKEKERLMINSVEGTLIEVDYSLNEKEEILNLMKEEIAKYE